MSDAVSCLVADDHPALVAAVCSLLRERGYAIVGPASDGRTAVTLAERERPQLALVDFRMPRLEGLDLLAELRQASPDTALVVYTAEANEQVARDALGVGVRGLVLKEAPLADVVRALDAVRNGGSYVDAGALGAGGATAPDPGLTERELAVLRLVADGLTHEEIGARLGIGAETVRTHLRKACARLGAAGKTQAVAAALRLGLIS